MCGSSSCVVFLDIVYGVVMVCAIFLVVLVGALYQCVCSPMSLTLSIIHSLRICGGIIINLSFSRGLSLSIILSLRSRPTHSFGCCMACSGNTAICVGIIISHVIVVNNVCVSIVTLSSIVVRALV